MDNPWIPPPPYQGTSAPSVGPPTVYPNVVPFVPIIPPTFNNMPFAPFDNNVPMAPILPYASNMPVPQFVINNAAPTAPFPTAPFVQGPTVCIAPQMQGPVIQPPSFNITVPIMHSTQPQKINVQVTLTIPQHPVPQMIPLVITAPTQPFPIVMHPEMFINPQMPPIAVRVPFMNHNQVSHDDEFEGSSSFADNELEDRDSLPFADDEEEDRDEQKRTKPNKIKKPKKTIQKKNVAKRKSRKPKRTRDYIPRKCKAGSKR